MTIQLLTVDTPASSTALTTRDTVKAELNITSADEDDYIDRQIVSVSARIAAYLNVGAAEDGTLNLGRETLTETVTLDREEPLIILSRRPLISVTSIVQNGITFVEGTGFRCLKKRGAVYSLSASFPYRWLPIYDIVIAYVAGWLLPNDDGRNLPVDIEDAAISWIKANRAARERDPAIKSEQFLNRTYAYEVFPTGKGGDIPDDVAATLARYREIVVA